MKARDPYRYFTMPFRLCRLVKFGETSPTNPVRPNLQTKKGVNYARSKSFKAFQNVYYRVQEALDGKNIL